MYTYCKKYGNKILLREHTGEIQTIKKHTWDIFYPSKEGKQGDYKTIDGVNLIKSTYSTVKKAMDGIEYWEKYLPVFGAKNFGYQYIRDVYLGKKETITPKDLYIANIDIETGRDEKGYSTPDEARCPITAITLNNISENTYVVWGYNEEGYFPKSINVKYVSCSDELDMLRKFVSFIESRYPDIITGWNVEQYDITYVVNRIKLLIQGEDSDVVVARLSPFGIVNEREAHDAFGNTKQVYDILGISTLDYLPLFKKFTYITPENYKLDTIAHLVLNDKKIDYSEYANLQDLYEKNYEKFIDYNIKDADIITRLDKKLRLFDLILSVAYKAGINFNDVVSPVTTWDILIYNAIMDQNMVPPLSMPDAKGGKYIGAYVKEPVPGMYNWIMSVDLNSLYPHLQMGINISPEKRLKDKDLPPELQEIRSLLGTTVKGVYKLLDESIDTSALKKYNVTIAPNGQFYKRDGDGFIPVILEGLYNERKAVKRSMLDDKQKMEDNPELQLDDQIAAKNTLQMALKILMNSEYGAMANKYFRYFELRNAEAVTSSGQLAILWVAKQLNIFLNRIIKTENEDYIIAIDTDSVYINLEKLVEIFIKTDDNSPSSDKIVNILSGWGEAILEPQIEIIYENLASYVNSHKQKMVMGREVIANKGFWTGKKRYALNVYDNEGVRYSKPKTKIMGLECVRSSVPEFCRNYIKEAIVKILTEDEKSVQNFILDVKDKFFDQPPEDISFPRGTNNIEKWEGKEENIISPTFYESEDPDWEPPSYYKYSKKGTPIHVRGCIVYNKFLDDNHLTDERIQSGDKVKFCYLKTPNIFRSNIISFPPAMPQEVYDVIKTYIDYDNQWTGTFYKPVNEIMKCVNWSGERIINISDVCGGEMY